MQKNNSYDVSNTYHYENGFYLTSKTSRLEKLIQHYEFYKSIINLTGYIVECGVFKGASLVRWLSFREIIEKNADRKIVAFDTYENFPKAVLEDDRVALNAFCSDAGEKSLSVEELSYYLEHKGIQKNVEFVKGNLLETAPKYVEQSSNLEIALLHIDVDLYESTKVCLETFYPFVQKKGVIILDDYGFFPGATKAIDEFFAFADAEKINKNNYPAFVIKN